MTPQELKRKNTEISKLRQQIGDLEAEKRKLSADRAELKARITDLNNQINTFDRQIGQARRDIEHIERSIDKQTKRQVQVSEHAMLRYVERVIGIDLKELEKRILPDDSAETVRSFGDGEFPIGDHKIRVRNGVIVTVFGSGDDQE